MSTNANQTHDFMRTPVVLHALPSFDDSVLVHTASSIIAGLSACLLSPTPLRNEIANSPDFWSILQRLRTHKPEAEHVFEMLTNVAVSEPSAMTADNYEAAVSLANDFAAMGSVGAVLEQPDKYANRRRQQPPPPRKQPPSNQTQEKVNDTPAPEKPSEEAIAVQRALKALSLIHNLTSLTPGFIHQSHLDRNEAWAAYWSPIFRSLCAQCINPCREIRRRAVSALQRVLLSEDLAQSSSPGKHARSDSIQSAASLKSEKVQADGDDDASGGQQEWTSLFTEVLFPLILRLLKPDVYQLDTVGMGETRVQCATVLTKIFLRYLDLLAGLPPMVVEREVEEAESDAHGSAKPAESEEAGDATAKKTKTVREERPWLLDIWTKTLQLLERLMNSGMGQREQEVMTEAVVEGVKNCLLVMAGSGYLERPQEDTEKAKVVMWRETMRRVERVVPGLWAELFPELQPEAKKEVKPEVERDAEKGIEQEEPREKVKT